MLNAMLKMLPPRETHKGQFAVNKDGRYPKIHLYKALPGTMIAWGGLVAPLCARTNHEAMRRRNVSHTLLTSSCIQDGSDPHFASIDMNYREVSCAAYLPSLVLPLPLITIVDRDHVIYTSNSYIFQHHITEEV